MAGGRDGVDACPNTSPYRLGFQLERWIYGEEIICNVQYEGLKAITRIHVAFCQRDLLRIESSLLLM